MKSHNIYRLYLKIIMVYLRVLEQKLPIKKSRINYYVVRVQIALPTHGSDILYLNVNFLSCKMDRFEIR